MLNPSLREIPVHEPADVIPSKQEISLLTWLESTGRLIARDTPISEVTDYLDDEEEISELMSVDDSVYDDDDDDDIDEDLLEG
ncbi:hypothetical protein PCC9214_00790 [Planktothrix tepida]|uniref:DUF3134 domain-containing protein n=3 Tax=Planktothrix TaxID=54304 RepID=A0A1J1LEU0_9CYAN|nr:MULTISPECIES: DUF3134 domain-containing protein [Planktothrix]MBD2480665.1 DUF3134 domain-containing protein [Planktothrix sp. FACHB-1365]MBE9145775.1 DUF3134 domain-containing protein [Planktothrix mougeotii LEGE 06226]CAD5923104.1 hypothetical protein PCC9214_00790 [Planktothrix tepida]CAD5982378.1 hypothetical protein NO713_04981 [Planktothrix pseudagardhii]CUR31085.1 conserved hypothetical protein [Planktothrix tepida PCC 9214]